MHCTLTTDQCDFYHTNGFLAIDKLLTDSELALWRRVVHDAVDHRVAVGDTGGGDSYYQRVFTQCMRLADDHPSVRDLVYAPDLAEMAARLARISGIRCWHDQALFKGPYGHPTGWHLDNPFWSFSHRQAISVWIALDDATLANGCLWYKPRTHTMARFDETPIGAELGALFRIYPEWEAIAPVATPIPAGGAVFHNALTAHAAGCNLTGLPRRAMTMAWMPDGAIFNGRRNILPDRLWDTLKLGDVLNDPVVNPLLWHQAKPFGYQL